MQSYIFRQTNNLLRLCTDISKTNKLYVVPFPSKKFTSIEELETYNSKLMNMINAPYLFYLSKEKIENDNSINLVDNDPQPQIPKDYFSKLN